MGPGFVDRILAGTLGEGASAMNAMDRVLVPPMNVLLNSKSKNSTGLVLTRVLTGIHGMSEEESLAYVAFVTNLTHRRVHKQNLVGTLYGLWGISKKVDDARKSMIIDRADIMKLCSKPLHLASVSISNLFHFHIVPTRTLDHGNYGTDGHVFMSAALLALFASFTGAKPCGVYIKLQHMTSENITSADTRYITHIPDTLPARCKLHEAHKATPAGLCRAIQAVLKSEPPEGSGRCITLAGDFSAGVVKQGFFFQLLVRAAGDRMCPGIAFSSEQPSFGAQYGDATVPITISRCVAAATHPYTELKTATIEERDRTTAELTQDPIDTGKDVYSRFFKTAVILASDSDL